MIEDLDKAFAKYRGAYHIGSKSKASEARKRKEQRKKKSKNRRLNASNNRRKRACIIFRSLGGEPVELRYEPNFPVIYINCHLNYTLLLYYFNLFLCVIIWGIFDGNVTMQDNPD